MGAVSLYLPLEAIRPDLTGLFCVPPVLQESLESTSQEYTSVVLNNA